MEIQTTTFHEVTPHEVAQAIIRAQPHTLGVVLGKVFNAMEGDSELCFEIRKALVKDNRACRAINTLHNYIDKRKA